MPARPRFSIEEGQRMLYRVWTVTQVADPSLMAPRDLLTEFHNVLRVIANRNGQRRYELYGLFGITMGALHRRTGEVLRNFDSLVEENPRARS